MSNALILTMLGTLLLGSPYTEPVDKALYYSALTLTTVDWAQTRYIAEHPDQYYEKNSTLGRHPSLEEVDRYFAVSWAVEQIGARVLPRTWSRIWLASRLWVRVDMVTNNYSIGIGVKF